MKAVLAVAFCLIGAVAWGDDCRCTVSGKVVAVPDGGSVWVYVASAQASYRFALAGVKAPSVEGPEGKAAQNSLAQLVWGQEVCVDFDLLCDREELVGNVFLQGQSVNNQIATLLMPTRTTPAIAAAVPVPSPHRPLLGVYLALRQILPVLPGRD